jgi:hypothetical protein
VQYLRARYYAPETGRFVTEDTWLGNLTQPQTLNRYAYVANNPVNFNDPSGNLFGWIGAAVGAVVGAVGGAVSEVVSAAVEKRPISGKNLATNIVAGAVGGFVAGGLLASGAPPKAAFALGGMAGGFVGGAMGSLLQGNSIKDSFNAGLKGAVAGGVAGFVGGAVFGLGGGTIGSAAFGGVFGGVAGRATSGAIELLYGTKGVTVGSALNYALNPKAMFVDGYMGAFTYVTAKAAQAAAEAIKKACDGNARLQEQVQQGRLTGTTKGLTQAERAMVNDLLNQGKNVEILVRSNAQGVPTVDFKVNGVLTELKTLGGTSLNTPVTRITEGFAQGAETVILDARATGLTAAQADTVLSRVNGIYKNNIPGKIEIWTNKGIIYGGK